MGGRSGGSYGASARPKFEGGRGGMGKYSGGFKGSEERYQEGLRKYSRRRVAGQRGISLSNAMRGSLGAAAYRPAVIEELGARINRIIRNLKS